MNRRDFLTAAAGTTAVSMFGASSLLAIEKTLALEKTTPLYVRGLAMLSFGDPQYLRIALPRAPHHAATLVVTPSDGTRVETPIHGHGHLEGIAPGGQKPEIRLPELIHIRELYRDAVAKLDQSPSIISIPWSAVRSVSTNTVSDDRWTFVFKDSGEDVGSFRPRKIAESLKIDLVSTGTLKLNDGALSVPLEGAEEVRTDFTPTSGDMGGFEEHFSLYMPYVETSANAPTVVPKKLGRQTRRTSIPALGNSFARVYPFTACFLVEMD